VILDSHAHLWRRDRTPQPWIDGASMAPIDRDFWLDDLHEAQREAGIDGTILVQSANSASETIDLLSLAADPGVRGVVGWIDLTTDVASQLERVRQTSGGDHLVGIRHLAHQDPDDHWLRRPDVGTGLEALAEAGLVFDLVVRPDQLADAAALAAEHPAVTFVLDHLGKPPIAGGDLTVWSAGLRAIAASRNVHAKLSGLVIEADWSTWSIDELREPVELALEAFGPSRLMFGSDWPLTRVTGGLTSWVDAARDLTSGLSQSERDDIFGRTAAGVYRPVPPPRKD
jgi:L-fuconolactonase